MPPRWAQSIRFRMALAYAFAVFTTGALFIGAVYMWQVNRLNRPIDIKSHALVLQDPRTGQRYDTQMQVLMQNEVNQVVLELLERDAYGRSLNELRKASLVGLGLLSVVSFGSGWVLAGATLRPMGRMAAVAREISATELSRRIALDGPDDELKDLADTFDEMLDRLQASFEGQRQFVQDASHELRNPLAVAQANLELVLSDENATVEELRRSALIAHQSAGRISHIVEDLVAQARHGVPRSTMASVDLVALAADVASEMQAEAARRHITITTVNAVPAVAIPQPMAEPVPSASPWTAGPPLAPPNTTAYPMTDDGLASGPGPARDQGRRAEDPGIEILDLGPQPPTGPPGGPVVHGDEAALRRAVTNLVANAVRLAPAGSTVTITTGVSDHRATVSVADEGPGIAPEDQAAVFERFWRGRDAGKGLGLGLSIVRQVAQRHGGTVELASQLGQGSVFTIALPLPVARPSRWP